MALNDEPPELTPKQLQLIYLLVREATKADAARKAQVPLRTMYNWLRDPRFRAGFLAARRDSFDNALVGLERNAASAVQLLADVVADSEEDSGLRVTAATRLIDRAFKAQGNIAVEEEMAELRTVMAGVKAAAAPVIVEKVVEVKSGMTAQEQAEACRLRVEWMGELGHPLEDITTSLRYNRPQSVEEERETLDLAQQQLEQERMCTSLLETSGVLGD